VTERYAISGETTRSGGRFALARAMLGQGVVTALRTLVCLGAIVLAPIAAGCLSPASITCEDGRVCPQGSRCDDENHRCVDRAQESACAGHAEAASCVVAGAPGRCLAGACTPYFCGDGTRTDPEQCDGSDLHGKTCLDLNFYGETTGLRCNPNNCTFDTTGCTGACGDGIKNGAELCDGDDLGGADCKAAGFYDTPGLKCSPFCTFDVTACTGTCGDGVINGPEICDGDTLGSATCQTAGFYDGPGLKCSPLCSWDVSACTGFCGDAIKNGPELCDGAPPAGQSCVGLGFDRGFLGCTAACGAGFDGCGELGWKSLASHSQGALAGIWGTGPRDAFAVGRGGAILHWDGESWTAMTSPTNLDLFAIWGSARDNAFAVGSKGTILHWDGATWSPTTSPTTTTLMGIWGTGAADVFAVGGPAFEAGGGIILHWDGGAWSQMAAPKTSDLHAVWGSGPNDVFAVGWTASVLHWDGTAWSAMASPEWALLNTVWGTGPNDVFAAGFIGMLHWDGTRWSTQSFAASSAPWFRGIWGSGPDDVYVYGDNNAGLIGHWNGKKWSISIANIPSDAPFSDRSVGGMWGSGPEDVFAVGPANVIFHGNATSWSVTTSAATAGITGVWGIDADNVYAVGNKTVTQPDGTTRTDGVLLGFNGTNPSSDLLSNRYLGGVWGSGPDSVLAVGAGAVKWDGATWSAFTTGGYGVAEDVWQSGPTDVFIVWSGGPGYDSDGIGHWDGQTWKDFYVGSQPWGIWGSGPSNVIAVGGGGLIVHWNGSAWVQRPSGTTKHLNDVWGNGPEDVFAVGATGTALHFDGSWTPINVGTTEDLLSVGGSGPGDIFITTSTGLLHRRAGTWESIALPVAARFTNLWVTPQRVYLFGTKGEIARLDRYTVTCTGPETFCNDGWDNDCDGLQDGADPDCAGRVVELCANLIDDDGDGRVDCADADCASFPACRRR
jgi:hypothetical protein